MKKGGGGGGPSYFGPQIQVPLFLSFLFFSLFLLILQVHFLRADRSAFWYVGPPQTLKLLPEDGGETHSCFADFRNFEVQWLKVNASICWHVRTRIEIVNVK